MTSQRPPPLPRQGTNSTAVRRFNERRLLTALRRLGQASKSDLSDQLNITQNAIGQIVQGLEQQELITSIGRRMGQRGQPATLLRLNPDGAYAIGIKVGCRSTESLLVDFTGRILQSRRIDSLFPDPDTAFELARSGAAEAIRALPTGRRDRLEGVGLVLSSDLFSQSDHPAASEAGALRWRESNVPERLCAALGCTLLEEQAGVAVALSELFLGHGREIEDFACLYVNSAICGGVVLQGDYRRGLIGSAGEIGLVPVAPSALAPAGGPRRRRAETVRLRDRASGSSLFRHLEANNVATSRAADLHTVLTEHPRLVDGWLDDAADALLAPVLSITALLAPQAVILDGNLPGRLIDALLQRLGQRLAGTWSESRVDLRRGSTGSQAAALGAALLPLHYHHQKTAAG